MKQFMSDLLFALGAAAMLLTGLACLFHYGSV